jgi:type IV pilus assembly protein PilM
VIEIKGHHFYNDVKHMTEWMGAHVRNTLLKNLREQTVQLPGGPNRPPETFTMEELGIGYVILAKSFPLDKTHKEPNPYYEGRGATGGAYGSGGMGGMMPGGMAPGGMAPGGMAPGGMAPGGMGPGGMGSGGPAAPKGNPSGAAADTEEEEKEVEPPFYDAPKYDFIVQFCWQEKQLTERLKQRELARQQEQEQQDQQNQQDQEQTDAPDDSVAAADLGG